MKFAKRLLSASTDDWHFIQVVICWRELATFAKLTFSPADSADFLDYIRSEAAMAEDFYRTRIDGVLRARCTALIQTAARAGGFNAQGVGISSEPADFNAWYRISRDAWQLSEELKALHDLCNLNSEAIRKALKKYDKRVGGRDRNMIDFLRDLRSTHTFFGFREELMELTLAAQMAKCCELGKLHSTEPVRRRFASMCSEAPSIMDGNSENAFAGGRNGDEHRVALLTAVGWWNTSESSSDFLDACTLEAEEPSSPQAPNFGGSRSIRNEASDYARQSKLMRFKARVPALFWALILELLPALSIYLMWTQPKNSPPAAFLSSSKNNTWFSESFMSSSWKLSHISSGENNAWISDQCLPSLLPIVSALTGAIGIQCAVLTTRGVNAGFITDKNWFHGTFVKETQVAAMLGIAAAIAVAATSLGCNFGFSMTAWDNILIASAVAIAMVTSAILAGVIGVLTAVLLDRWRRDPLVWASVLAPAVLDVVAALIVFAVCICADLFF